MKYIKLFEQINLDETPIEKGINHIKQYLDIGELENLLSWLEEKNGSSGESAFVQGIVNTMSDNLFKYVESKINDIVFDVLKKKIDEQHDLLKLIDLDKINADLKNKIIETYGDQLRSIKTGLWNLEQ